MRIRSMGDLLIIADSGSKIEHAAERPAKQFKLKEIGDISYYLGCRIVRDRSKKRLWILQDGYINQLATRFARELEGRRQAVVPVPTAAKFELADVASVATKHNRHLYQQVVGSMMYASPCSRADIAYALGLLSNRYGYGSGPPIGSV